MKYAYWSHDYPGEVAIYDEVGLSKVLDLENLSHLGLFETYESTIFGTSYTVLRVL